MKNKKRRNKRDSAFFVVHEERSGGDGAPQREEYLSVNLPGADVRGYLFLVS